MPKVEIELDNGIKKVVEFDNGFTDDDIDEVRNQLSSQYQPSRPIQAEQPEQPTLIQGGVSKNVQYQEEHPIKEAVRGAGREIARSVLPEKAENWFVGSKEEENLLKEYGNTGVKNYDQLTNEYQNGQISKQEYIDGINLRNQLDNAIANDEYRQERNKNLGKGIVDIGTGFIPVGAGAKITAKGAQLLKPALGKTVSKAVAQGTVGGALGGAAMGLGEGLIDRDINPATQSLLYGGIGGLTGGALGGIGGNIANKVRAKEIAKRKATPRYERMSEEQLNNATTPASNYGVADIDSARNQEIAQQINDRVQAEQELLNEYKQVHSDLNKKYGSIEKLKKQASKDNAENAQYGATTDAMRDYQNLVAYENELANARYVNNPYKIASTGDRVVNENAIQNSVKGNKTKPIEQPINVENEIPETIIPEGTAQRGGLKTVRKYLGDDVANSATDTTYAVRGKAVNKAEFENLTAEQQQKLINDADDLSDLATYAKAQHINNEIENGNIPVSTINRWLKGGTEKGQALQSQKFLAPDTTEGAIVTLQSEIIKSQPKHVQKIVNNSDEIINSIKNISKELTPEQRQKQIDKLLQPYETRKVARKTLVENILKLEDLGGLDADNFYKLISKKYKITEITPNDVSKLKELTANIRNAGTDREKIVAEQLLAKEINKKLPADWAKKERTYRTINMLLSPKSRSKDIFSSVLYQGERAIDEAFAQIPALVREKFTGIKTRSGLQPKAWLKGAKRGLKEVGEDVRLGINTGRSGEGSRFDLTQFPQFEGVPVLDQLEKALGYTIKAIDRPLYEGAFESSLANQMKARGLTEPTEEMIEQAVKEAKEAVFQGDSLANNISVNLRNQLDKATGSLQLGQRFAPFITTVSNLATEGVKSSPFGLLNSNLYKPAKTIGQMRDKDLLLGKVLKGAALYAPLGAYLANNQDKTNIGDLGSLNMTDDVTGLPVQGIAVGDKAFSLANMPQATIPVSIYKSLFSEGTPTNRLSNAVLQAGSALTDLPAFTGIGSLVKGGADIARAMGKQDEQATQDAINRLAKQTVTNFVSQEVPLGGALGNIRNAFDPNRRELMVEGLLPYVGNRIKNRLPFVSETLPLKYNVLGDVSKNTNIENDFARFLGETIDPVNIRNYNPKPIEMKELEQLQKYAQENDISGASNLALKMPKRQVEIDGQKVMLDNETYSLYSQTLNSAIYDGISNVMNSEYYENLPEEEKIKLVRNIQKYAKEKVDEELLGIAPKQKKPKLPSVVNRIRAKNNKVSKELAKGIVYGQI